MLILTSDLETYLQKTITGTSDEDKYYMLRQAVQDAADSICNRKLEEDTYTEIHDGNGNNELYLNNYPITSITAVEYGDTFGGSTRTALDTSDYLRDDELGRLVFQFYSTELPQVFSVSYTAGYTADDPSSGGTIPYDLKLVLMEEIENRFNKIFTSCDIKSEKLGDYSYTKYSVSEMDSTSIFAEKLTPYRKNDL